MYSLNFFQNGRQVDQDAGLDKFIWLDMLMVRERLMTGCIIPTNSFDSQGRKVSIRHLRTKYLITERLL
jgi:hypothetical protein